VTLNFAEALTQHQWEPVHCVREVPDDMWCAQGSLERRDARIEFNLMDIVDKVPNPFQGRCVDPKEKVFANEDLVRLILQYSTPYLFDYAPGSFPFKAILYYNRNKEMFDALLSTHRPTDRNRYATPYAMRLLPSLQMCSFDLFEVLQAVIPHVQRRLSGVTGSVDTDGPREQWTDIHALVDSLWKIQVSVNRQATWDRVPGVHFHFRQSELTGRWCLKSFFYHSLDNNQTPAIAFYLKDEGDTFN